MRLKQNQLWRTREGFLRITRLERWEVAYKQTEDRESREGTHHVLPKKEFCRLLKGGECLED